MGRPIQCSYPVLQVGVDLSDVNASANLRALRMPTRYLFVINLKTAKSIDPAIPPSALALAGEVIHFFGVRIYEAGRTGPLREASSDRSATIASQAIVARCCRRIFHYTIVQRYIREQISYWLCRPAALKLRRSQDGRNAVCLRRAEG
jgi:hypothetical protein